MLDIEESIKDERVNHFVTDFVSKTIESQKEYRAIYDILKKKYKLCPNKPTLLKTYNTLLKHNKISENQDFVNMSLKKKTRSISGVTVITILTSPHPHGQKFSCSHNCSYCPDEPTISINIIVKSIISNNTISIITRDDISLIRLLTYVIKNEQKYIVNNCSDFTDKSFDIEFKEEVSHLFQIGDEILGIKRDQPRSYLSTEPAVLRANRNGFDAVEQIYDRSNALLNCGHEVDKIEVLVLGGTWDSYPLKYQEEFIRDIYYGINTLTRRLPKPRLSLQEEISYAQYSDKRIIGLTLETRPDYINLRQIRRQRKFNVTRLQIGVQHIHDDVLETIQRGCYTKDTIKANYLWKNNGGKIDWHLMFDLPGSSIEKDLEMVDEILGVNSITEINKNYFIYDLKRPDLQADQYKLYPCEVVDFTEIKKWYDEGFYKPYSENEENLIRVLKQFKNNVFPWIRINRIIRDIPNINIKGGNENVNLRETLLKRPDINCKCIRCREVKNRLENIDKAELFIREYNAVNSTEYFISFESPDNKILYGFVRLRINHTDKDLIYKELKGCSHIRELHVYGKVVNHNNKKEQKVQHMGFGKKLIKEAEKISMEHGVYSVAIISGVGVREYYHSVGYKLVKDYMIKNLKKEEDENLHIEPTYMDDLFTAFLTAVILILYCALMENIFELFENLITQYELS
jgi:ELP3 family radical SAM enzyme/protein acetyltransferase